MKHEIILQNKCKCIVAFSTWLNILKKNNKEICENMNNMYKIQRYPIFK